MMLSGVGAIAAVLVTIISVRAKVNLNGYNSFPTSLDEVYGPEDDLEYGPKLAANWPSASVYSHLGSISAAAVSNDDRSRVFILNRGDHVWNGSSFDEHNLYRYRSSPAIVDAALVELKNGHIKNQYLTNKLYMPHGLTIDDRGNIWITDVAMHQVFKYNLDLAEEPLLTLGELFVPGNDDTHFCKPTSVAVAKNGDFFVADGYCNNRILKFAKDGTLLTKWGEPTQNKENPGFYELDLPHQLALLEEQDQLCVADRENYRVVCYHAGLSQPERTGLYLYELNSNEFGSVMGLAYSPFENLLALLVRESWTDEPSRVELFDLNTQSYVGRIEDPTTNFGAPHLLATCPSATVPGCLIVCSSESPQNWPVRKVNSTRRLWFYNFESSDQA